MIHILILGISCLLVSSCKSQSTYIDNLESLNRHFSEKVTQNPDRKIGKSIFGAVNQGNYIEPVTNLVLDKEKLIQKYPPELYYQSLATSLSTVGEYKTMLEAWAKQREKPNNRLDEELTGIIGSLTFKAAEEEIIKQGEHHQVIMINEAHHIPEHRFFTQTLLEGLYKQGFTYLAAETLSHRDIATLNQKKVPSFRSGIYISEPQYANLLRKALALGFTLVAYEDREDFNKSQRDSSQAKNLMKVLEKDPDAKILVHAGYAHIYETTQSDWVKMGEYFKKFSGIDPLTINQVDFTDKGNKGLNSAIYKEILDQHKIPKASIPLHENGFWVNPELQGMVDLQIVHPRLDLENGRPLWLSHRMYEPVKIPRSKLKDAFLIQAFKAEEIHTFDIQQLVPVDQILVKDYQSNKYLYLPRGERHLIRLLDVQNNVLEEYQVP
ncbi:MAG: hypothetical protein AAFY71_23115 [Bacteroidota bacterium]